MTILTLLLIILVGCVILWGARSLLAAFQVGEPISTVVYVLLVVLVLIWILMQFGVVGSPSLGMRITR